jgi:alkanesulfonate monooxygenase SsuD/methylene tetrahydromethanopterin reductase-like flavin-dependent oxidoreductase (luciferase family)
MTHKVTTLDHLSSGIALLGVGAGEKFNVDMYGLSRDKVLSKLREYIELIRLFWTKKKVSKKSEFWGDIKKAFIQLKPIQKTPPIYIAANMPKTRQLTGELVDGWFPFIESPRSYKENKKEIVQAAKNVGRDPDKINSALQINVALDNDNPEKAKKAVEFFRVVGIVAAAKLNQIYPNLKLPKEYVNLKSGHNFDIISDLNKVFSYKDELPKSLLTDNLCVGTTEDVITTIKKFKTAGVTQMAFFNEGPDKDKVFEIFRDKIIPYFREEDN